MCRRCYPTGNTRFKCDEQDGRVQRLLCKCFRTPQLPGKLATRQSDYMDAVFGGKTDGEVVTITLNAQAGSVSQKPITKKERKTRKFCIRWVVVVTRWCVRPPISRCQRYQQTNRGNLWSTSGEWKGKW